MRKGPALYRRLDPSYISTQFRRPGRSDRRLGDTLGVSRMNPGMGEPSPRSPLSLFPQQ
jgi:hypothetical protein